MSASSDSLYPHGRLDVECSVSTSTAHAPSSVASAPAASADKHKPLPMHRHMTDLDQHFLHLSENSQSAEEWEVAQITAPHLFMVRRSNHKHVSI